MNKDITPLNNKGEPHGYWEWYWYNGKLMYKCFYHNDKEVGYEEFYDWNNNDGRLTEKNYHL